MTDLNAKQLRSFSEELSKTASGAGLARQALRFMHDRAGISAAGMGTGGALGALAGAGVGGTKGYREARDAGASRGQALLHSMGTGAHSAATGAIAGAALGTAAGALGGGRARQVSNAISKQELAGAPARFVQRQLHSLTGYASPEQLKAMRGPAEAARLNLNSASEALRTADPSKSSRMQRLVGKALGRAPKTEADAALKQVRRASAAHEAAQKAEQAGLTSIPGVVKGLTGHATLNGKKLNPLEAVKTMAGEQWHGSGPAGKALMLGLPAAGIASALGPEQEGSPGRAERVGQALGTGLAYSTPLGIVGQSVLAGGLGGAGRLVGAGADTLRRRKRVSPSFSEGQESDTASAGVEKHYSNAALGLPPEGAGT